MTYGWTILVVMVLGVALWQVGIFNMGGSMAPTTTGFSTLKPLLATCELGKINIGDLTAIGQQGNEDKIYGFMCQFTNNAGADIQIFDVDVKVDGGNCNGLAVATSPQMFENSNTYTKGCGVGSCDPIGTCFIYENKAQGVVCDTPEENGNIPVTIPAGSQFTVITASSPGDSRPTCLNLKGESRYGVSVNVKYYVNIGGMKSEKGNNGVVEIISN